MRITDNLARLVKGLITSLGIKAKLRPHKYKNARYAIKIFSEKELSKIITEFEKLPYESYEKKGPKHDPIDSYFYLARHIVKWMMKADFLNSHGYPVRTEMTATNHIPTSHVCYMDESENSSQLTKICCRSVPRTRTNQKV